MTIKSGPGFNRYSQIRSNTIVRSALLFMLNPFLAFCVLVHQIHKKNYAIEKDKLLIATIPVFYALLSCTQYTKVGDICRTYDSVIFNDSLGYLSIFLNKYPIFDAVNLFIYHLTGRVEFISIFWTYLVYFLMLKSVVVLYNYYTHEYNSMTLNKMILITIFCLINFIQVTELLKQAFVVSLFAYIFSLYTIGEKGKCILLFIIGLGVHYSILFFLPILFVRIYKSHIIFYLLIASFAFRSFNLMGVVSGISELGSISDLASNFSTELDAGFFKSSSFFFVVLFWTFFITSILVYFKTNNKESVLIKAAMVMIIILNLNYSISHNFTRLMTTMYPFYAFLLLQAYREGFPKSIGGIVIKGVVVFNILANTILSVGRLNVQSEYGTSFMDNSLAKVVFSTSYQYLTHTKDLYN